MTYPETVAWLFEQTPVFQRDGAAAYKPGLDAIASFCSRLGNPHLNLKTIHVAGTNGKGSTSSMMASVLQEEGLTVGLYTSPHLKDFRERIRINGEVISEEAVVQFIEEWQGEIMARKLTFFEVTTALAFFHFSQRKVDVVVLETGMGGRLDATNIVQPILSVITRIGMDHGEFLGSTLRAIAGEKAGIIKPNTPVVLGPNDPVVVPVFQEKAAAVQAPIIMAQDRGHSLYPSDLIGPYQSENQATALSALVNLPGLRIKEESIRKGFLKVSAHTGLRGRWEILGKNPLVVADTAHNAQGLAHTLPHAVKTAGDGQLHLVMGFASDKDLVPIWPLLPRQGIYYLCAARIKRARPANELLEMFKEKGLACMAYSSVNEAFDAAKQKAGPRDFIYVGGSTFVVAEIL